MKKGTRQSDISFEKVWLMFQETDRKFQETDRMFQETDRKFRETDEKLRRLETLFVGQWGMLVESLVEGKIIELLNERNIQVQRTFQNTKAMVNGKEYEIDILAVNGKEVVVIEVKTSLKVQDITEFIEKLKVFRKVFPEYKDKKIYGAVAYLRKYRDADKFAYRSGLFVIKATGDSARIVNDRKFKPRAF